MNHNGILYMSFVMYNATLKWVSFRCSFVNKMADETRNPDRYNTETYGVAHDESQPMRTRDYTGSSLYYIINIYILLLKFLVRKPSYLRRQYGNP